MVNLLFFVVTLVCSPLVFVASFPCSGEGFERKVSFWFHSISSPLLQHRKPQNKVCVWHCCLFFFLTKAFWPTFDGLQREVIIFNFNLLLEKATNFGVMLWLNTKRKNRYLELEVRKSINEVCQYCQDRLLYCSFDTSNLL